MDGELLTASGHSGAGKTPAWHVHMLEEGVQEKKLTLPIYK
jgi:hypothetical protein